MPDREWFGWFLCAFAGACLAGHGDWRGLLFMFIPVGVLLWVRFRPTPGKE